MELTFRQKSVLSKLFDMYQDMQEPIHYSVVAERLGLSKSTAYDMLRLLERKGFVVSEYSTPKKISGPGRSSVSFIPSQKAAEIFSHLARGGVQDEEWEDVKARILSRLSSGEASEYAPLKQELIKMIPKTHSPLACCAEIITTLLLSLKEAQYKLGPTSPLQKLLTNSGTKLGMSIVAGVATGLMAADKMSHRFIARSEKYNEKYQKSLDELTPEAMNALNNYTRDLVVILSRGE